MAKKILDWAESVPMLGYITPNAMAPVRKRFRLQNLQPEPRHAARAYLSIFHY
jgi:hypothetical protein